MTYALCGGFWQTNKHLRSRCQFKLLLNITVDRKTCVVQSIQCCSQYFQLSSSNWSRMRLGSFSVIFLLKISNLLGFLQPLNENFKIIIVDSRGHKCHSISSPSICASQLCGQWHFHFLKFCSGVCVCVWWGGRFFAIKYIGQGSRNIVQAYKYWVLFTSLFLVILFRTFFQNILYY